MGLRIHKTLGYGMPVSQEQYEHYLEQIEIFEEKDVSLFKEYIKYISKKYEQAIKDDDYMNVPTDHVIFTGKNPGKELKKLEELTVYDFFIFIESPTLFNKELVKKEDSPEAVLLIVPPAQAIKWHRTDDSIDYVSHSINHEEPEDRLTELQYSPFPYEGMVMNTETGEIFINNHLESHIRNYKKGLLSDEPDKFENFYKKYFGYYNVTPEEAVNKLTTAAVPKEIQDLVETIGLVKPGEMFIQNLTPMIADYWE